MALNVVMLARRGGEGHAVERLAARQRLPKISTGDILRKAVQTGTELGGVARHAIDAGKLVGDAAVIGVVKERLDCEDARVGFVLDGFPRTVVQATALDSRVSRAARWGARHRRAGGRPGAAARRTADLSQCGADATADAKAACTRCGGSLGMRTTMAPRSKLRAGSRSISVRRSRWSGATPRVTLRSIDGHQPPDVVTAAIDAAIRGGDDGGAAL